MMVVSYICTKDSITMMKKKKKWMEGEGQNFFSHSTSDSWEGGGGATHFPPKSDYKILEKYNDINGRILLLKCKCKEATYVEWNLSIRDTPLAKLFWPLLRAGYSSSSGVLFS